MIFIAEFYGGYLVLLIYVGQEYGQVFFVDVVEMDLIGANAEGSFYYLMEH